MSFRLFRFPCVTSIGAALGALCAVSFAASDARAGVTGNIAYGGGFVNTHPQIMMVYVGNWDNSPKSLQSQATIEEFLTNIGGTPYFNTLSGYHDKAGNHVVNEPMKIVGRLYDPDTTAPADWHNVNPWIDPFVAQQPENTIFFIVPSAGIGTWCGPGAAGCNGMTTDVKHNEIVTTAVDSNGDVILSYGSVWLHEIGEVITDGHGDGWTVSNPSGGGTYQIGDACDYSDSPWQLTSFPWVHLGNHDFQVAGFPVLAANYNSEGAGGMRVCSNAYGPAKPPVTSNSIVLTGRASWSTIPVADYAGHWSITNNSAGFASWSSWAGAERLTGDFDGDGKTDLVATGPADWAMVPFAFSTGGGNWKSTQHIETNFAFWSSRPSVKRLVGDFNGDGKSDIALTGSPGWTTIPVGFSNGDGSLNATNQVVTDFPSWAQTAGVEPLVGDFDGDGDADIALTGPSSWSSVPVALSSGDGTFRVVNAWNQHLAAWAATANVVRLVGDFNGDGKTDFAVTGGSTWGSIPTAFSVGDGTWNAINAVLPSFGSFGSWSATPGVVHLTGDFNGDGKTDIALVGVGTWSSIPMAFSNGDGTWNITNQAVHGMASWSSKPGVTPIVGDFNGDGRADIALTGNSTWDTIPLAFSNGDGTWDVTNNVVANFPTWAGTAGVSKLGGHE